MLRFGSSLFRAGLCFLRQAECASNGIFVSVGVGAVTTGPFPTDIVMTDKMKQQGGWG